MILTCPECATSYFVDDARIPPEGRRVKCTSCGARWLARKDELPDDPLAELADEPPPPPAETFDIAEAADEPAGEPETQADSEDDLVISGPEPEHLRRRPAAAAAAPRRAPVRSEGRSAAVLWGGMAAFVAALVAGLVVFREDVVRLWPQSSAAFAGVGLDVAGGGLVIESVHAEPVFVGGRPALEVTGAVRNARGQAATSPPIRVSLLDKAGKPVAAKIGRPLDGRIPGHARRHFALAILDPPADAHDLQVTFDVGAAKSSPAAPHAAEAENSAGPEPVDAKPLEPGSPDAAPHHG